MKRVAAWVAGLVATAATVCVPMPAQAFPGDSISFTAANFTKVAGACVYHPFDMSVAFGSTTDEIDVEVRVTGPQGEFVDSYYEFLEDPGTYRGEVFICSSLDPDGLYTISLVEGTAYDFEFNSSSVNAAPVSFTVFPPPAPPAPPPPSPPPPSPAPVVDVEGKTPRVFKLVGARRFEVRLATKPLPAGSVQGKKFKWLVKIDGRQVLSFSQGPSTSRKWQSKALSPSKHKIVIKGNGVIRFKGTARF